MILFYKASFIFPKKNNLILFGSMNGIRYGDNSRHLFEWIIENKPDIEAIWITNSNEVYSLLKSRKLPVVKSITVKGLLILGRSRVACYTNSLRDIVFDYRAIPRSLKLIALRHGRGIKRVRFARNNHKISEKEKVHRIKESKLIVKSIACSDFQADIQEKCLLIGRDKHIITGYPRNDWVLKNAENRDKIWFSVFKQKPPSFTLLYAPTWRHGRTFTKFFPFSDFTKMSLINLLDEIDGTLLLRPHVHDYVYNEVKEFFQYLRLDNDRVKLCTHEELIDVNTILPAIDTLITDWCSVEHDYILLNRPILYIPYDYDDFEKNNGFLYDYFDNTAGPVVYSFVEFSEWIKKLFKNRELFSGERISLLNKIHYYQDAGSCKRVYNTILSKYVQ